MAVTTSKKDENVKYAVKSSKNNTIKNTGNPTTAQQIVNVNNSISTTHTATTSSTKSNGNSVGDSFYNRISAKDRYEEMKLNKTKQETYEDKISAERKEKYAGIYTDDEQGYLAKLRSSNNIIGRDYRSEVNINHTDADLKLTYDEKVYGKYDPNDPKHEKRLDKGYNLFEQNTEDVRDYESSAVYRDASGTDGRKFKSSTVYGQNTEIISSLGMKSGDMDDGNFSNNIAAKSRNRLYGPLRYIVNSGGRYINLRQGSFPDSLDLHDYFKGMLHSKGLWRPEDINLYKNYYRFGALNPTLTLTGCKEFLFFTKTDLNIYTRDNKNGSPGDMNSYLASQPFWQEMALKYPDVLKMLQSSIDTSGNPFNFLLSNMVQSNLDLPNITAESIDTPANMYGVNYDYRGSSEASDDSFQFSLEFRDTKFLPVYHYFKAYDDYQTIKHHGYIEPWYRYITSKILYDHFAIFKILVDDDMETILYYAKLYGVKPMSVPREAFSNTDFSNGLSYNVEFKAAFVRDMQPYIINDFNYIAMPYANTRKYQIDVYNPTLDRVDNRATMAAYIERVPYSKKYDGANKGAVSAMYAPGGFVYKLRWKGDAKL